MSTPNKRDYSYVVFHGSTTDISNLDISLSNPANIEYYKQEVCTASKNMISAARNFILKNPRIEKVLIVERPPRFDPPDSDPAHLKAWLSDYANGVLHDELAKSNVKQRVFVCPHSLPQTFEQDLYGHPARRGFDGVHLHGSNGCIAFTHSMCNILQHNLKEHSRETHKHLFPGYTNCPTLTTPNTFASQQLPSKPSGNINTKPDTVVIDIEPENDIIYESSTIYAVPTYNPFSCLGNLRSVTNVH